jgi:hypothetical protein
MSTRTTFQTVMATAVLLVVVKAAHGAAHSRTPDVGLGDPTLSLQNGVMYRSGALFTGRLIDPLPDGTPRVSTEYEDGLRHGMARGRYEDGGLAWERTYVGGLEEGTHRGWWEDGSRRFVYEFRAGLLQGQALEWYRGGQLYRDFTYEDGREAGRQRMWFPDGTPRANYVVRDGRRYGLVGSKGCVTDESESGASAGSARGGAGPEASGPEALEGTGAGAYEATEVES